jgi:hypothetical protein
MEVCGALHQLPRHDMVSFVGVIQTQLLAAGRAHRDHHQKLNHTVTASGVAVR